MSEREVTCLWYDNVGRPNARPAPARIDDPAVGASLRYAGGALLIDGATPTVCYIPESVGWDALNAAANWLFGPRGAARVRLRYYIGGWAEETVGPETYFARIDYIEAVARRGTDPGPHIRPVPISGAVCSTARSILQRISAGALEDVILYHRTEGGRLHYAHIGSRTMFASLCTPEEVNSTVGRDALDDPGEYPSYGRAVVQAYQNALETNQPVADLVTACVRLHGRERRWIHYRRLSIPVRPNEALAVHVDPSPPEPIVFA